MAELRHLGGALARKPVRRTARSARFTGEYMTFAVGIPMTPEIAAAIHVGLRDADRRAGPVGQPARPTSTSPRTTVDPAKFYSAEDYARLRRVKAEVDPTGLLPRQPRNLRRLTG